MGVSLRLFPDNSMYYKYIHYLQARLDFYRDKSLNVLKSRIKVINSISLMYYTLCRINQTLSKTPAMAAMVRGHVNLDPNSQISTRSRDYRKAH